jgi:predicted regulator of Ras-like GTPase activity (Roadblock/LC7/MglB family)
MTQAALHSVLQALRDIAGVHGSFVIGPNGALVGKDLPAVFHDALFVEVGARLSRFLETMDAEQDEVVSAIFRFDEHRLYVSRFSQGLLAVVTSSAINAAALKMASTLTVRRLEPLIASALTSPPPAVTSAPPPPVTSAPPPAVISAPPPSLAATRIYRGRVVPT